MKRKIKAVTDTKIKLKYTEEVILMFLKTHWKTTRDWTVYDLWEFIERMKESKIDFIIQENLDF